MPRRTILLLFLSLLLLYNYINTTILFIMSNKDGYTNLGAYQAYIKLNRPPPGTPAWSAPTDIEPREIFCRFPVTEEAGMCAKHYASHKALKKHEANHYPDRKDSPDKGRKSPNEVGRLK